MLFLGVVKLHVFRKKILGTIEDVLNHILSTLNRTLNNQKEKDKSYVLYLVICQKGGKKITYILFRTWSHLRDFSRRLEAHSFLLPIVFRKGYLNL
jgi:hypothetical protein